MKNISEALQELPEWYRRINRAIAIKVTGFVGSMTCAWLFAAFALWGFRQGLKTLGFQNWFAEEFLQLVLLSVIMVGQNVQSDRVDELHKKFDHHIFRKGKTQMKLIVDAEKDAQLIGQRLGDVVPEAEGDALAVTRTLANRWLAAGLSSTDIAAALHQAATEIEHG